MQFVEKGLGFAIVPGNTFPGRTGRGEQRGEQGSGADIGQAQLLTDQIARRVALDA